MPTTTLSEGLIMPYANCIIMGSAINSDLTPSRSTTYKVMNEFVIPKFKNQPTILLFILQFNFDKLEALLS